MAGGSFNGVPKQTFTSLKGLTANNDKAWFGSHRDDECAHRAAEMWPLGKWLLAEVAPTT